MASAPSDLGWILAPVKRAHFTSRYMGQAPLKVVRSAPDYYRDLVTEADVEQLVYLAARSNALEERQLGTPPAMSRSYGEAVGAYRRGKTLRVDGIHRFSVKLGTFCRSLEQDLGFPIYVNLYLTPPATQALPRHYDKHDVFVLQVLGQKRWHVYDDPVDQPLDFLPLLRCEGQDGMRMFRVDPANAALENRCTPELIDDFTLSAGDVLYLPRGWWHQARAEADHLSAHLTVGVDAFSYIDLLTIELARIAREIPSLRQYLPFGSLTHVDVLDQVDRVVHEVVGALPQQVSAAKALAELGGIFGRSRGAVGGALGLAAVRRDTAIPVTSETDLELPPGLIGRLIRHDHQIVFSVGPAALELPAATEKALQFMIRQRAFRPADLPDLTSDQQLALADRLLSIGWLRPAARSFDAALGGQAAT